MHRGGGTEYSSIRGHKVLLRGTGHRGGGGTGYIGREG